MTHRNWKRTRARSLRHAIELCLEYAREHQLSVDRVADLMGLASKWTLYKWLQSGRMPAVLIRPFEHACGATFLTDYLAASAHKLLVDAPQGRRANDMELAELHASFSEALQKLLKFYDGAAEAPETLDALTHLMKGVAWHRENVSKSTEPELALKVVNDA